MTHKTRPLVGADVESALDDKIRQLTQQFELSNDQSGILTMNGKIRHRWMTDVLDERSNHPVKQIIIDAARQSERVAGGSGDLCFSLSLSLLTQVRSQGRAYDGFRTIQDDLRELSGSLLSCTKAFDWKTTCSFLRASADKDLFDLLTEAIRLAGCESTIEVIKGTSSFDLIEMVSGFKFNYGYETGFASLNSWSRNSCRILLIDGIIETISEINSLLEECASSKTPVLILARGFANDVMQTLSINMMRKTLDVVPIVVPYDLEGANALKDVATCCGTDIVSSLKGELISKRTLSSLVVIPKIQINDRCIIIQKTADSNVSNLIRELRKKRQESNENVDLIPLLDKRLRSLSAKLITVRLTDGSSDRLRKSDLHLRQFLACVSSGIVSHDELFCTLDLHPQNLFARSMRSCAVESYYPLVSLLAALRYSESVVSALSNTGSIVLLEV